MTQGTGHEGLDTRNLSDKADTSAIMKVTLSLLVMTTPKSYTCAFESRKLNHMSLATRKTYNFSFTASLVLEGKLEAFGMSV